ncbi:MAG: ATP-binding cassette domain-containing protein, partial [Pseudomonadota bacterium]
MTPASVVLALDGLTKCFGHVVAVDGVDLRLHRGEVLALLGENGAGKTTLMNMLFGHYLPDAGKVRVADGAGLRALPLGDPRAALAAGIGMVHQHFTLALNLSAFDNVVLGTEPMTALRRRRRAGREKLERLMAESGLVVPLDTPLGHLQVGERQRVEILKALYRDVRILILDEPTAVLTPQEADGLFLTLRRLAGAGLGVIFISHKLREVLAFSDRITVLRGGRNVAELATADADGRGLAEIMVGHATDAVARPPATPGDAVLSLRDVSVHGQAGGPGLRGCDLDVRSGEIVGLAGVSGNGQAALAALLSGLRRPTSGVVS